MPTHDYIIANGTGAAVRADINSALSAIVSLNSSASEPGTMYAYQLWADTGSNPSLLKIRNGANSAWITLRQLDGDFSIVAVEDGLQATPSLTFTNDLNTGIFRPGNDSLAIVTGATRAITITSTQAVGIQTANPSSALHVAGNARVGADDVTDAHLQIGKGATGNRNSYIDIVADTTYTDYGLRVIRNNTGANATSELKHRGTGALNITTQEAAPIVFNTTNSPALTITSGGLVGIGTTSPGNKLHIADSTANTYASMRLEGTSRGGTLDFYNGATALSSIVGSTNGTGDLQFYTGGLNSLKATIDASGRLLVGTSTSRSNFHNNANYTTRFQLEGTDFQNSALSLIANNTTPGDSTSITLAKSAGAGLTSNTLVANNELLGDIRFEGSNGTNFVEAGRIRCEIDGGTPLSGLGG